MRQTTRFKAARFARMSRCSTMSGFQGITHFSLASLSARARQSSRVWWSETPRQACYGHTLDFDHLPLFTLSSSSAYKAQTRV